jgi:hypothetical protein
MDFCIEEWDTGCHVAKDLSVTDMQRRYTRHKKGLTALANVAFSQLIALKENIYNFGM